MSDLKKPITGHERYQEGWLGVPPLEEKKKEREINPPKNLFRALFVTLMKKFTALFSKLES